MQEPVLQHHDFSTLSNLTTHANDFGLDVVLLC